MFRIFIQQMWITTIGLSHGSSRWLQGAQMRHEVFWWEHMRKISGKQHHHQPVSGTSSQGLYPYCTTRTFPSERHQDDDHPLTFGQLTHLFSVLNQNIATENQVRHVKIFILYHILFIIEIPVTIGLLDVRDSHDRTWKERQEYL